MAIQNNENKLVVPAVIAKAIDRQPDELNPLQPTQYRFISWKTPETVYFCQRVSLPGISIGTVDIDTPLGIRLPSPASKFEFEDFEMTFLVNEDMSNWREIDNWLRGLAPMAEFAHDWNTMLPEEDKVPLLTEGEKYSDGSLMITTSNNQPSVVVEFHRMFPYQLQAVEFDSSLGDPEAILATVSFKFSHYTIKKFS